MNQEEDRIREKVIGAAMAVHRTLGPVFLESVYQRALAVELRREGVAFVEQAPLAVRYRGETVGEFVADFLVEEFLILELKAVQALLPAHEVQTVNYLAATGLENALLLNFGARSLEFRRKFRNAKNPVNPVNPVNSVSPQAFTILELLVAMAVMAVLLVLLLNMVDSATKLWRENENRVDSYREARAALGIIGRDLQNAVAGATNTNHFLFNAAAFSRLQSVSDLQTDTNLAGALLFLTSLPANAQQDGSNRSDVCQVGYFLAFGKSSASTNAPVNTMNIYRFLLSSDQTFDRLRNTNSPLFPDNLTTLGQQVELLARNVTRFTIRPLGTSSNSVTNFVPSTNAPLPDLVEITISAINQDAAKKLGASASSWTTRSGAAFSNLVAPVEQTFTTRVRVNQPAQ
ncbi:MAG: GxxExxY protein [Terrimicrobiaceae bacterium]|nr:GxxExxY protein [Terrimicrobiaceae bacterium]